MVRLTRARCPFFIFDPGVRSGRVRAYLRAPGVTSDGSCHWPRERKGGEDHQGLRVRATQRARTPLPRPRSWVMRDHENRVWRVHIMNSDHARTARVLPPSAASAGVVAQV